MRFKIRAILPGFILSITILNEVGLNASGGTRTNALDANGTAYDKFEKQ